MKYKYIVCSFYSNIPKRIVGFNSKNEAYEYISGLRICETPYLFFTNEDRPRILDVAYYDMPKDELIRQFENEEHL